MPADERVSGGSSIEEAVLFAQDRARDLVRALARERQGAAAGLHECRADLEAVVLAAVEGLEALGGIAEAFAGALPADAAVALDTAVRGAWERLEMAGVIRDGAVGERLDVARHKVVKRRPSSDVAPNTVVQVLSPGLVFRKVRLREAAVVVSKAEGGDAAYRD
jgi:hypothetical protein